MDNRTYEQANAELAEADKKALAEEDALLDEARQELNEYR